MTQFSAMLVKLALAEVGVEEVGSSNCGPRVNQYKAATNLPPAEAWPWCAAFICWLVRETMEKIPGNYTFRRPTTAGAWAFENLSLAQDNSTQTKKPVGDDLSPGDIVIFKFSHIGLCVDMLKRVNGVLLCPTVEGNTDAEGSREGGGVFRKLRKVSQIRSRIRFTI